MEENEKLVPFVPLKRVLAVLLLIIWMLVDIAGLSSTLVASGTANSNLNDLREMNDTLSEMNDKLNSMSLVPEESEPAEGSTPAEEVPSYAQEELIAMAVSDDFSNMMEVALYPEATESQLLFIATACAYSDSVKGETSAVRLATALLDHPNVTKAVVSTLAQSKSTFVWLLVAQSELCSESTLAVLADHCINVSFGTTSDDPLISVVSAICENGAVTEDVLNMFEHSSNNYIRFIVDTKLGNFPKP